jgi:hypothetical protein
MDVFGRRDMLITDMLRHVPCYVFIGTISNFLLQRPFSRLAFINAHHNIDMTTVQLTEILLTKHLDRVEGGLLVQMSTRRDAVLRFPVFVSPRKNGGMRSALFWDCTPCRLVAGVPTFRDKLLVPCSSIGRPETSVTNYQSTLSNSPEERRSYLHRGGSLNSLINCGILHSIRPQPLKQFSNPWFSK